MSTEDNKTLHRRFVEEVFNQKNLAAIDKLVSPDVVDHNVPPGFPPGREGKKQFVGLFMNAFSDAQITYEDLIAEGDKVVGRFTFRGTHKGELFGIPPTNKQVAVTGIDIVRYAGGQQVEHWVVIDQLGMMQQVGVIPAS